MQCKIVGSRVYDGFIMSVGADSQMCRDPNKGSLNSETDPLDWTIRGIGLEMRHPVDCDFECFAVLLCCLVKAGIFGSTA